MTTPIPEEVIITLYKYIKAEHLPGFLNTGYLKVSKIGEVNDPFEYAPCFDAKDAFNKLLHDLLGASAKQTFVYDTDGIRKDWIVRWNSMVKHGRVKYISFSTLCSSPLMWGHYADNHKGICLVFRFNLKELNTYFPNTQISTIIYSKERVSDIPLILSWPLKIDHDAVFNLFQRLCGCTKSKDWEYEKEVRLYINPQIHLRERKGFKFYGDIRAALRGVILGINFENNEEKIKREINEALQRNPTTIIRAQQSLKEYKVKNDSFADVGEEEYARWADLMGMNSMLADYQKVYDAGLEHQKRIIESKLAPMGITFDNLNVIYTQ